MAESSVGESGIPAICDSGSSYEYRPVPERHRRPASPSRTINVNGDAGGRTAGDLRDQRTAGRDDCRGRRELQRVLETRNPHRTAAVRVRPRRPPFGCRRARAVAAPDVSFHGHSVLHAMFNAYWEPLTFALPPRNGAERWRRWLDTALPSPDDIGPITLAPVVETPTYTVHARSVVVLAVGVKGSAHGYE